MRKWADGTLFAGARMVSTYLTYNLVNRDMKSQLDRISKQSEVTREQKFYDENIGKVKTADEFVDNTRLFNYAMKAYGLEDMTYAKAFMKKVLNSDLNDDNSFANKLTDDRYRKFVQAFQFGSSTAIVQTPGQTDDVIDHYKKTIDDQAKSVSGANAEFKAGVANVKTVDDLLGNEKLRTYALKAFEVDSPYWDRSFLTKVLTSDVNDPASFVNTLTLPQASSYKALAAAFNFNASGALDTGVSAQNALQTTSTIEAYTFSVPNRITPAGADLNKAYFEANVGTVASVDDLVNDSRMLDYIKTAYGLDKVSLKSTMKNILTSDLTDPNNYATTFGGASYEALTKAFNFKDDGSINGTSAQTQAQTTATSANYMQRYDDKDGAADEDLYTYYRKTVGTMDSVEEIHGTAKLYNFVLSAFGFDSKTTSQKVIDQALESDLSDPASFANKQKDPRFKELAAAFNFDAKGEKTAPLLAQSEQTIQQIASEYVVLKTRFGNTDAKEQATKDASAYTSAMQDVKTRSDFLSNRKLVDFVLQAKGIDPKDVTDEFMKSLFTSDLSDPKSVANQQTDHRYLDIVTSFNFNEKGEIGQRQTGIQDRHGIENTHYKFLQQSLETTTGEDSAGARLALYFKRMMPTINTAYDILGDTALLEVFRTAFSMPAEMSTMDIDKQKVLVEKNLDLEKLQDPEELEKFISRFTSMYDLANDSSDPIMSLFGSSSGGISADTLLSIVQLRSG